MAVVEVTISGVLYDKLSRTTQQVVLVGEGSLTGLGVGGGPMPPGQGGGGGQPPLGIWGPTDPRPNPPIANAPGLPPTTDPPTQPPTNPPDPNWTWGWNPSTGWIPVYAPEGGKPHPPYPAVPEPK